MRVLLDTAPGSGKSYVFTLRKNAADTLLTCTVADANLGCVDCSGGSHNIAFTAGDRAAISSIPSGTPASVKPVISLLWQPTTLDETIITFASAGNFNTTAAFVMPLSGSSGGSDNNTTRGLIPIAGTVKSLYTWCSANVAASATRVFTIQKNGSATGGMTCTQAAGTATCNDTGTSPLSLAAGDQLNLAYTATGTPGAANCAMGLIFVPTTSTQFILGMLSAVGSSTPTTGTDRFAMLSAVDSTTLTTEDQLVQRGTQAVTVKTMQVKLGAALGASSTVAFTLNDGTANPTAETCNISGAAATTCTTTTDVTIAQDHLIDTNLHHTGSAGTSQNVAISYGAVCTATFP